MLYGSECWALSRVDARKVDALDQWCLRRILYIRWYHRVSNCEVRRLTEQPPLTSIIQKRRLTLFGHLVRMDESTDARRILTAVSQSEWRRPVGRPYTSWIATLKNDLALHNLTLEDAIELALNKPLWRLLAACGATHWWCMPNNDEWWWWCMPVHSSQPVFSMFFLWLIICSSDTFDDTVLWVFLLLGDAAGVCIRTNHHRWNRCCNPVIGTC